MSRVRMKTLPRILLAGIVFVGLIFGFQWLKSAGYLSRSGGTAVIPQQANLPELAEQTNKTALAQAAMPSDQPANISTPEIRMLIWAWNAQMGALFANGGAKTTTGSIMAGHNVNLSFVREDDVSKMQAQLVAFAKDLKDNPQPKAGAHYVAIMGDGAATFIQGIQGDLYKICEDCTVEVIGSAGYSRGEDKFMGLPEWKTNPKAARGCLIAGVIRDGDWNIAQKWAGDNSIKNNPDEKTWDPDALNWIAADSYIDAGQKYITGVCENRKVVRDGKATGETKKVCVNGVVTWTPGDVNVAKQKGGLASIVSTKEYRSQMPNTIIGIKRWNQANHKLVENMLAGIFEGGDQVKTYDSALKKAAQISAVVYKEEDAAYWEKYYHGVTEADKQGLQVQLGGSSVNNLADNLQLFGLAPGSANVFAATYKIFGDIVVQQYPDLMPGYPTAEQVLNTSYIKAVSATMTSVVAADLPKFTGAPVQNVVSKRSWSIEFESGLATFTPAAEKTLRELANGLLVADDLAIEIHGYTDNTGDDQINQALSAKRAGAVKEWLMKQSSSSFPAERFTVAGHGSSQPVASNSTPDGRARNRRVVIVMGN